MICGGASDASWRLGHTGLQAASRKELQTYSVKNLLEPSSAVFAFHCSVFWALLTNGDSWIQRVSMQFQAVQGSGIAIIQRKGFCDLDQPFLVHHN